MSIERLVALVVLLTMLAAVAFHYQRGEIDD